METWGWALRDFGRWLEVQEVCEVERLDRACLHAWQEALRVRLSPASQQVAIGAVRSLLRWADREEVSAHTGLAEWLETPRVPDRLPRALEPDVLRSILRHYAAPTKSLERLRDRALFLFLVTSGCRISEALQVNIADLRASAMIVRQKGGSEQRLVPSARAREWVNVYLRARGIDGQVALWVATGRKGRRRLAYDDANRIWRKLAEDLGVPRFTNHALRHTAATELLERGATELDVQQQLGHRSLATVHRYARVREARRQSLVDLLDDLVPPAPTVRPAILKPLRRRRPPGRSA